MTIKNKKRFLTFLAFSFLLLLVLVVPFNASNITKTFTSTTVDRMVKHMGEKEFAVRPIYYDFYLYKYWPFFDKNRKFSTNLSDPTMMYEINWLLYSYEIIFVIAVYFCCFISIKGKEK